MNILFLYPRMFYPYHGGIERVTDILCREFRKRGHNVLYLNNINDSTLQNYSYPAKVYFFPMPGREIDVNGPFYRDFLKKHEIDIVINQDIPYYHNLISFSQDLKNVHVISVVHNSPLFIYDYLFALTMRLRDNTLIEKFKRIARIIKVPKIKYNYYKGLQTCYKDTITYSDRLCLLSLKFIPELRRVYDGDLKKVISIGNPNTYSSVEYVKLAKKKQLIYVGRVEWYQKRTDRLFYIWKHLFSEFLDWELIIVGDGPIKQMLESKFSGIPRVSFVGYQEPKKYYQEASILCLTSDFEGWGMVLTEAMNFGVIPVLYNSFASAMDIVEDWKTGVLVPPFSRSRYVYALKKLMKDEDLRKKISSECLQSVRKHDLNSVANQWESLFSHLKS